MKKKKITERKRYDRIWKKIVEIAKRSKIKIALIPEHKRKI